MHRCGWCPVDQVAVVAQGVWHTRDRDCRLDGGEEALRAKVPCCYGQSGFQVSGLGFPGAGCWKVTARVGQGSLSFVALVEKIGEGPPACEARVTSPNSECSGRGRRE